MENLDPALNATPASTYGVQPDTPTTDRHNQAGNEADDDVAKNAADDVDDDVDSDELDGEAQPTTVDTPVYRGPFRAGFDPRRCDPRVAAEAARGIPRAPSLIARLQRRLRAHPEELDAAVQALLDAAGDPRSKHLVDANKVLLDRLDGPVVKRVETQADQRRVILHLGDTHATSGSTVGPIQEAVQQSSIPRPAAFPPTSVLLPGVGPTSGSAVGDPNVLSVLLDEVRGIAGLLVTLDARVRRLESVDGT